MKKTAPHDTLVFIVDMQDGMWADNGPDLYDLSQFDDAFRGFLHRQKIRQEEKRHEAMHDMVTPIHGFVESVRDRATPVWVTSLWEGTGDLMAGLGAQRGDLRLQKNEMQSAVPENTDTLAGLKDKGYRNAVVIGAFAGLCVRNTAKDLKDMGFNVAVVGDLVIDDTKPGDDDALATALYAIEQTGVSIKWLNDMKAPAPVPGRAAHFVLDFNG